MATAIHLQHPDTGIMKTGYYGFSWTSLFFGGFPALIRGNVGVGLGVIIAGIVFGAVGLGIGWFFVGLIWAFIYNKHYTTKLIENGYRIADTPERNLEAQRALGVGPQAFLVKAAS